MRQLVDLAAGMLTGEFVWICCGVQGRGSIRMRAAALWVTPAGTARRREAAAKRSKAGRLRTRESDRTSEGEERTSSHASGAVIAS
jgi:hypothetical protein